ncbi:unnamed protein product [marine sediment metagenome]|uniref:Carbon storage regulator n=1 Tax=marine sediment metagenome TaxID=412755 RepID=X1HB04_9ZZZZ
MLIRELNKGYKVTITHEGESFTLSLALIQGRQGTRLAIDAPRSFEVGKSLLDDSFGNR